MQSGVGAGGRSADPSRRSFHEADSCTASSWSQIATEEENGERVSLNSRIRRFNGAAIAASHDVSCTGTDSCNAEDAMEIQPGHAVSVQCNGVRQSLAGNRAVVICDLDVDFQV